MARALVAYRLPPVLWRGRTRTKGSRRWRCPILAVIADRDLNSPVSRLAEFTRATVPLGVVAIEKTGHAPMLERPDTFNAVVSRFLDTLRDCRGRTWWNAGARAGDRPGSGVPGCCV